MQSSVIHQLEDILASKYVSRRVEILERVTDLFVVGSGRFSPEHVDLFDHVMVKLLENTATGTLAQLGSRLAVLPDAPPQVIRQLAGDDAIAVAGPILRQSEQLGEQTLLLTAKNKSQDHLLAIAGRKLITEPITDVLVDRGDANVVTHTAKNDGARFSTTGFSGLVTKATDNTDLALTLWSRPDVPQQALVQLFAQAPDALRNRLAPLDPAKAAAIQAAVAQGGAAQSAAPTDELARTRAYMEALQTSGRLTEAQLHGFAKEGSFDKVALALAVMTHMPFELVARAFRQPQPDQLLILAKALDLSWVTTVTLLFLQASVTGRPRQALDQALAQFNKLQPKTAQATLQAYRNRQSAAE